jgi:hypothetical protein
VAFDDHPAAKRSDDGIETVTVDSVFAWLQRSGLGFGGGADSMKAPRPSPFARCRISGAE